jgi:rRNA maturation endonuclease Nob1
MVRCNMCMEVYSDYDVNECPECKTNAYMMDLSPEEVEEYV